MGEATLSQYNETDSLKTVIIGRYEGYRAVEEYTEIVNEEQKKGFPSIEQLKKEFDEYRGLLKKLGVEVLIPDYVGKFVYDQLTPRDIGVTIGDQFVLCNMVKSSRRYECAGIFNHILGFKGPEPNILIPDEYDCLIEGGDIVVDKNHIYVGISQRTNQKGFEYLKEKFGEKFEVVPVYARSLSEGENILHLDCTFNPVGNNHALIYKEGFREIPEAIRSYDWIEITKEEQAVLGTNVLSVSPDKIINRKHEKCDRINNELRKLGFEVFEVEFNGAPSTGGSFRCCSLPLVREKN